MTPQQAYEAALARHMGGDLAGAEDIYRRVLGVEPHAPSLMALGVLCGQAGRYQESAEFLAQAAAAMPQNADAWSNLGNVLRILEKYQESVEACNKATEVDPGHAFAWANLSAGLRMVGRLKDSLDAADRSISLDPSGIEARVNRGSALQQLLRPAEAIDEFQAITRERPESYYGWSCLIMGLQYSDRHGPDDLAAAGNGFGALFPVPPKPRECRAVRRVAFISGDFCSHPVGQFIHAMTSHWDTSRHELFFYSNLSGEDEHTKKIRALGAWRNIHGLPDDAVCSLIQQDQIDLLVDLAAHSAKNRIGVLAMRPAPFAATYLGGSTTTGLGQVDFIIADEWLTPPDHEWMYSERTARLKGTPYVLDRAMLADPPARIPGGPLRLGSFNNPAKISPACLSLWAAVMKGLPGSVLVLKYRGLNDKEVLEAFTSSLAGLGISRDRLELHGWMSREEHWALTDSLDLGLDTWPYTGATTTCDLLARGVPCPTLIGDRYPSRMSASALHSGGLDDLICRTPEEYVELCIALGQDHDRRQQLRTRLGTALAGTRLCDGPALAKEFQDLADTLPSRPPNKHLRG